MLASSITDLIGGRPDPARLAKAGPALALTDAVRREPCPDGITALAPPRAAESEPDTAGALHILGLVAESRGEFAVAERWYRRSLNAASAVPHAGNAVPRAGGKAAANAGSLASQAGNAAHVAAAAAHNARAAVVARAALGCVLLAQGDHDGARVHLEAALAAHRCAPGSRLNEDHLVANLCVAYLRRDVPRARRLAGEALKLACEASNLRAMPEILAAIAVIAVHMGLDSPAGRLFGAAEAVHSAAGTAFAPGAVAVHRRARDLGRLHLSPRAFDAATLAGQELSLDEATDLARRVINVRANRVLPCGLTRRELEVADLVGTGLTNKQIARRLVLGERTIDTHMAHIRSKLGALTRQQIAAWAAHRRLVGDPDPS